MQKRLIAFALCAVLVSAMTVTSVVSASDGSTPIYGIQQLIRGGISFIIGAIHKFWQHKLNPTLHLRDNLGGGICIYDPQTDQTVCFPTK